MKFTDRNGQSVSFELYNHPYINASQAKMILTKMNITVDNSAWFIKNIFLEPKMILVTECW